MAISHENFFTRSTLKQNKMWYSLVVEF